MYKPSEFMKNIANERGERSRHWIIYKSLSDSMWLMTLSLSIEKYIDGGQKKWSNM